VDWRILERISPDFYILSHTQDTHVRYAPLYITSFPLNAPRKQLDAQLFQNRYDRSELLLQWHPEKNGELTPDGVSYGSQKKI
jgi:hypothetical protein